MLQYELDQITIKCFFQMTTFEPSSKFGGTVFILLAHHNRFCEIVSQNYGIKLSPFSCKFVLICCRNMLTLEPKKTGTFTT